MPLLYERHETPEHIEVKFKILPLFYWAILVAIAISLGSRGQWTNICMSLMAIVIVAWVVLLWKPMREIHTAMISHGVLVSGSKLSFANPIRFVINK